MAENSLKAQVVSKGTLAHAPGSPLIENHASNVYLTTTFLKVNVLLTSTDVKNMSSVTSVDLVKPDTSLSTTNAAIKTVWPESSKVTKLLPSILNLLMNRKSKRESLKDMKRQLKLLLFLDISSLNLVFNLHQIKCSRAMLDIS